MQINCLDRHPKGNIMRAFTLSALALATALSAGVASAQSINPGIAQLAAAAGVSADGLTADQLIRLTNAQRANDTDEVNFILSERNGVSASTMGSVANAGTAQLAAGLGVNPAEYTTDELYRAVNAQRANDDQLLSFILSGGDRATADSSAADTPAKAQLAADLGVNPSDYSLAQLTLMIGAKNGGL
jgi:hypothetical protein